MFEPTRTWDLLSRAAKTTPTDTPVPEEEEYYSSWSLFLVCILLILSLLTSYYLQIKRIRAVHETLVSIAAGCFVGLIIRISPGEMIREMLTFRHTIFFNLLLPPIILNSGYELKQENFFRNFGSILVFAFVGTFISAVGVGLVVFVYSMLGLESLSLTLLECLMFGSTLSATDPVTILAIFNQYKVDPQLYSIIFGESLLNDAVSIVMYETLAHFHSTPTPSTTSLLSGVSMFLLSFSLSTFLGIAVGLLTSLLLKHSNLNAPMFNSIETCLVALAAYTTYFLSNGLSLSGIVSLLFCGITLKHYAYHTMSRRTQRATKYIFSTLAQLSENFIFVYLGMSLFTSPPTDEKIRGYVKPLFIIVSLVAVIFTRYAAVFPLSAAINLVGKLRARQGLVIGSWSSSGGNTQSSRHAPPLIPHSHQMMLFWAGLRGAVGVALAAGFTGNNSEMLRTTVLVVVVLTVIIFGGTTARMLEVLGIRTGVNDGEVNSDSEDERPYMSSSRRFAFDEDPSYLYGPHSAARVGSHYGFRDYNHHQTAATSGAGAAETARVFSASSSDDFDSDGEVLPLARPPTPRRAETGTPPNMEDDDFAGGTSTPPDGVKGKWNFQTLDERFLLPLFSNATASRTFHARRAAAARRSASGLHPDPEAGELGDGEDEEDDIGAQREGGSGGGADEGREIDLTAHANVWAATDSPVASGRMSREGLPSPAMRTSPTYGERLS
ncbi:sodium/hydrogen exchanger [Flagelloscypha sp. PMI_526]|nr:sodium/hydrogen exchanger [Flagelloscypha sp. PMI_526]